ncbi:MAG: capsular polysaccharide biosynthesis protein [Clostridia bacterium]|nr:capsular polysaccharide biosynthesis protein [Clostridia bacterium]
MKSNNVNSFAGSCKTYGEGFWKISDFHSHVLPGMDDGAKDVTESLAMLSRIKQQGISSMVSTSHFYADRETPDSFLARRAQAVAELIRGGYHPDTEHPLLCIGAEVAFFTGMARSAQLERLCISGTRFLLIEMPFAKWSDSVINEVLAVREALGLKPIIAHIERYIDYQKGSTLGRLIEGGVLIQSNAEYFTEKKTCRKALKLLLQGGIHLLGSDAHNLDSRPPNLDRGLEIIAGHKYGEDMLREIEECSAYVLKKAKYIQTETETVG